MAQPPIYRSETAPRTMPLPRASGSFGGATAEAAAGFGAAVDRVRVQQLRLHEAEKDSLAEVERIQDERRLSAERLRLTGDLARFQQRVGSEALRRRESAAAAAEGHVEGVRSFYDEASSEFLGGIDDPRLRDEFAPQLARLGASTILSEEGFAAGTRADYIRKEMGTAIDTFGNNVFTNPTMETLTQAMETLGGAIERLPGTSAEIKARLASEARETLGSMLVLGMRRSNPEAAQALLASGALNPFIPPARMAVIESQVMSEVRFVENQREAALANARAMLKGEVDDILKRLRDGIVIDDGQLEALQKKVAEAGLGSDFYDIAKVRIENNLGRATLGWKPRQYEEAINGLLAKGDKRSDEEDLQLAHLQVLRDRRARMPESELQSALGNPPPPLDWANGGSVAARLGWWRAAAQTSGRPVDFLTESDVSALKGEMQQNLTGRWNVAQRLMTIGDAGAIERATAQVAGDDELFRLAVRVGSTRDGRDVAFGIINGAAALKATPTVLDRQQADKVFAGALPALRGVSGEFRAAVREAAINFFASRHTQAGYSTFNAEAFDGAINVVLGGRGQGANKTGGLQNYVFGHGQVRATVLLPVGMTRAEFETRWKSLQNFNGWPAGSVNGPPMLANGGEVYSAQFVQQVPVAVEDGAYRVWTGNDWLRTPARNGQMVPFEINLRKATPGVDAVLNGVRRFMGN